VLSVEPSDGVMFTAYREVSDGSQPRTESDHVVAREAHGDVVTEPPRNQETSGRPASAATTRPTRWFDVLNRLWWKARQRRVVYLMVFCLCFLAAAGESTHGGIAFSMRLTPRPAIFTVVILESLRVESASISGGIRAIVLAIFCTPLVTYVCVTVVVIFRILRAALIDNQLDSQAHWDAYRGVMINVIEGCVVYPAILLNIIRAHSQGYGSQNAVSDLC